MYKLIMIRLWFTGLVLLFEFSGCSRKTTRPKKADVVLSFDLTRLKLLSKVVGREGANQEQPEWIRNSRNHHPPLLNSRKPKNNRSLCVRVEKCPEFLSTVPEVARHQYGPLLETVVAVAGSYSDRCRIAHQLRHVWRRGQLFELFINLHALFLPHAF